MVKPQKGSAERSREECRADRWEAKLDAILEVVRPRSRKPDRSSPPLDLVEALRDLAAVLERHALQRSSLEQHAPSRFQEERLARALLISGKGGRFEPSVRLAIREYRTAYENVQRYQSVDLPALMKEDVLVRFRQQLDLSEQTLQLLGVEVFAPEVEVSLDLKRHRVMQQRNAEPGQTWDVVAELLSPGFEWTNDEGSVCTEPARVVARVEPPLPARRPSSKLPATSSVSRHSPQAVVSEPVDVVTFSIDKATEEE